MISIKQNLSSLGLWGLILLLLTCNILLISQNIQMRNQLAAFEPKSVEEGYVLDKFQAKNLNNEDVILSYSSDSRKEILYFFRPSCGFCKKQMTYWKDLASSINSQEYRIVAITTETDTQTIKNYLAKYEVKNWDVFIIDEKQAEKADLLATPITVVVNNKGIVEKVWTGMWQSDDIKSAGKYFATNLFSK